MGRCLVRLDVTQIFAVVIFVATYTVVAVGRVPGLRIDRAGAAFLGAALMVGCGAIGLDDAYRAIDFNTIALLLGMMIVVANLRLAGFFELVTGFVVARARHPLWLLLAVVGVTGVLSALLVNDTICLVLTPLVLLVVLRLRRDPVPYLIAVALASNIGGAATLTGTPQNMIIGGFSGVSYRAFSAALAPVSAIGLGLTVLLVAALWRREFFSGGRLLGEVSVPVLLDRGLLRKTVLVLLGVLAAFLAGVQPAEAALIGGGLLLASRRVEVARIYREIDWTLLLMFAGLFVVVAGLEHAVLTPERVRALSVLPLERGWVLAAVTAVLANIVSNVPAVLVLKPFVAELADPARAWLLVAMTATLAGNFSLLGSVANLIVVQRARAEGVVIGFWTYFLVGAPLSVLTITAGLALLS
jgi:Na+/H+ antiporter NhaD/arsenite permease-like protein